MKKKFIISAAAVVLSVAAIGVSYALYKIEPDPVTFNISTKSTKDVAYTIPTVGADVGVLNPDVQVDNSFTIGGTKAQDSTYTQNIIVGNLSVTITLPNANYAKALVDGGSHIYLDINAGEGANHFAEHANFAVKDGSAGLVIEAAFTGVPVYLAGTDGTLTRKIAIDVEDQVELDKYMNDIAGIAPSSIVMKWEAPASYDYAYIVGNMPDSNWSQGIDKYQMVPNPKGAAYEWMYETTFAEGDEFKAAKGDDWSSGDNFVVTAGNAGAGTVFWSGSTAAGVTWYQPEP